MSATPWAPPLTGPIEAPEIVFDGNRVILSTANSVIGYLYQVQTREDLSTGTWINVGEPASGTGGSLSIEIPMDLDKNRSFYRLVVTQE